MKVCNLQRAEVVNQGELLQNCFTVREQLQRNFATPSRYQEHSPKETKSAFYREDKIDNREICTLRSSIVSPRTVEEEASQTAVTSNFST
jgi:hypothetical protein